MSETTYVPRAGSKAEAAIEALKANVWMSVAQLAEAIEVDQFAVHGYVQTAMNHGAVRKVAKDGKAGFMLAGDDGPPEDDDQAEAAPPKRRLKRKKTATPKREPKAAKPAKQNGDYIEYGHHVGILEDGTVIVIDEQGHAISLSTATARRIADLVARTA